MHSLMNIFKAILFGFFTGLVISIPLGPAGIESVKRTISKGYKEGFVVSLGALSADMAYLLLINCGLSNLVSTSNRRTEALFWIISGAILALIGHLSINKKDGDSLFNLKFLNSNNRKSIPFFTGFLITFSNPMTPSLWLTLSGTVIRYWYYVSKGCYYTFILSILVGMITWFALLNYFALKGVKILTPSNSKKASTLLMWSIVAIGLGFIIFGIVKLL